MSNFNLIMNTLYIINYSIADFVLFLYQRKNKSYEFNILLIASSSVNRFTTDETDTEIIT